MELSDRHVRRGTPEPATSEGPIAVAMSGGLDSSVVAQRLAATGRTVFGLSMLLWDRSSEQRHGRCCAALDLMDARRVAEQIGIPHYTLRMDEEFRQKVVDPFVEDYLQGRTPSPCVRCNTFIKFDAFLDRARSLGAERVATGHYARIRPGKDGRLELHTAKDPSKDQTYFLFELTQEQMARIAFPLGELTKTEVRELARGAELVVAEKGESMEVCFVDRGVQEFVEEQVAADPERYGAALRDEPSRVLDTEGRELGSAAPYYRYTVGQRRGLGISSNRRLYVIQLDPSRNEVRVGSDEELLGSGLVGSAPHWIGDQLRAGDEMTVKIRSRHAGCEAEVLSADSSGISLRFEEPQKGVTPGQAAVFYRGTRVLGGCWIQSELGANPGAGSIRFETDAGLANDGPVESDHEIVASSAGSNGATTRSDSGA